MESSAWIRTRATDLSASHGMLATVGNRRADGGQVSTQPPLVHARQHCAGSRHRRIRVRVKLRALGGA